MQNQVNEEQNKKKKMCVEVSVIENGPDAGVVVQLPPTPMSCLSWNCQGREPLDSSYTWVVYPYS